MQPPEGGVEARQNLVCGPGCTFYRTLVVCAKQNGSYPWWRRRSLSVACVGRPQRLAERGRPRMAMVCPTGHLKMLSITSGADHWRLSRFLPIP